MTYSEELWGVAEEIANKVRDHHTVNYVSPERVSNSVTGYVGQLSFYFYVHNGNYSQLVLRYIPIGASDEQDYVFRGYPVDIKSPNQKRLPRLLVKVSEFADPKDLYVLVWVNPESHKTLILGYATKEEVANAPIPELPYEPAHAIEFQQLHEPREALNLPVKVNFDALTGW